MIWRVQVGVIDNVEIDDAERADTRSRKVKRGGRTESACSYAVGLLPP